MAPDPARAPRFSSPAGETVRSLIELIVATSPDTVRTAHALVRDLVSAWSPAVEATRLLGQHLRRAGPLPSPVRDLVARWSLSTLLWQGRLRLLEVPPTSWPEAFLVAVAGLPVDQVRILLPDASIDPAWATVPAFDHPDLRLAWEASLPVELARRWIDVWGAESALSLARATNEPGPFTVRANLLRTDRDELLSRIRDSGIDARPGRQPTAIHLPPRTNLLGSDMWREGLCEAQDEASQRVIDTCQVAPGMRVLDACAGAGGKALGLAARMRNQGSVVAWDLDTQRLRQLDVRGQRAGASIVRGERIDATRPPSFASSDLFDVILVDAPCSQTGVLRRGPDARWRLALPDPTAPFVPVQTALLRALAPLVKPRGRLVYATCSVDPAENEGVAEAAGPRWPIEDTWSTRPDRDGCDGFFAVSWIRPADGGFC